MVTSKNNVEVDHNARVQKEKEGKKKKYNDFTYT